MPTLSTLPTPAILIDRVKLAANIRDMQATCDTHGIELRPHMKTHKMVAVARQQLAAGARGLTCAKLGEAEAMLPSGVRAIFVAHSLVDPGQAPRIAALADRLDDLRVALTSEAHLEPLIRLAAAAGRKLSVMMAIDTGLGREGVRDQPTAMSLAARLAGNRHLVLRGLYCHEGHFYGISREELKTQVTAMLDRLDQIRRSIDPALAFWPGCSVTARLVAELGAGRVQAIRPGAYVFGDLSLSQTTGVMPAAAVAAHVLATVVDRPEPGLALIDAGSKTFSSDRTPANIFGQVNDGRDISVVRVNEEHGYLRGADVDALRIGERLQIVPAHICTVINLASQVTVTDGHDAVDAWPVEARGLTQ
ncbi:MAG: alanine racemase [Lacunisphaera sp.]|nr:alanine racemase [Lacunisphaera sp.]